MKHKKAPKRRQTSHRRSTETEAPQLFLSHLLKGLLIALGMGTLILLSLSLVAYFCADPAPLILPLGLAGAGATALIGGFSTTRLHKHAALFCGLCNGCLLLSVMMILSLFFTKDAVGYSTGMSCLLHMGIPVLAVVGAYLGLPKSTPRKHRK